MADGGRSIHENVRKSTDGQKAVMALMYSLENPNPDLDPDHTDPVELRLDHEGRRKDMFEVYLYGR